MPKKLAEVESAGHDIHDCHHEEEDIAGGASTSQSTNSPSGKSASQGNQARIQDIGLDINQDGDTGVLETMGGFMGMAFGPFGGLLGAQAGDFLEGSLAAARLNSFCSQTHRKTNIGFQGWGNFDLAYSPSAGNVHVTVRIAFAFESGTPDPGASAAEYEWTEEEKQAWKDNFTQSVETTWSGQHQFQCLESDPELNTEVTWQDLQPGVSVSMIHDDANPHFNLTIHKIPSGAFARSSVSRPRRDDNGDVAQAGVVTLDSEDMRPTRKKTSPDGMKQRGAVHEFGHMIGLQDEYTSSASRVGNTTRQGTSKGMSPNASIMSGGEVVQQAHYSSILAGLNEAVAPYSVSFGMKS